MLASCNPPPGRVTGGVFRAHLSPWITCLRLGMLVGSRSQPSASGSYLPLKEGLTSIPVCIPPAFAVASPLYGEDRGGWLCVRPNHNDFHLDVYFSISLMIFACFLFHVLNLLAAVLPLCKPNGTAVCFRSRDAALATCWSCRNLGCDLSISTLLLSGMPLSLAEAHVSRPPAATDGLWDCGLRVTSAL